MPSLFHPDWICDLTTKNVPTPAWLAVKRSFDQHNCKMQERRPDSERLPEFLLVVIGSARCSYWDGVTVGTEADGWTYLESQAAVMTKVEAASIMSLDKNAWAWKYMQVVQFDPTRVCRWLPTANGWPIM